MKENLKKAVPQLFSTFVLRRIYLEMKLRPEKLKPVTERLQLISINIEPFLKGNRSIDTIKRLLSRSMGEFIVGAYVHGSVGSSEAIDYSDFDGLIIFKNSVFNSVRNKTKAGKYLLITEKIMKNMDPLQHHGWFVLSERDLENWPQTYFPIELFDYAKSLFPGRGGELKIRVDRDNQDYLSPFMNLANSILNKLESGKYPKNLYTLKNLLSEFMLLPSLYVQVRDKKGVFKKFSFDLARKDFSEDLWSIMDEVTFIRQGWNFPVKGWRRLLLLSVNPLVHKLAVKLAPEIPPGLKRRLTSDFYHKMAGLVEEMKVKCKLS